MRVTKRDMTITVTVPSDSDNAFLPGAYDLTQALRAYMAGDDGHDEHVGVEVVEYGDTRQEGSNANVGELLTLWGWLYGEHLKAEAGLPSEWNQSAWLVNRPSNPVAAQARESVENLNGEDNPTLVLPMTCGTVACAAGHVVLEHGWKPVVQQWHVADGDHESWSFDNVARKGPDGVIRETSVREAAMDILGLDGRQADALFDGYNSIGTMRRLISEYTGINLPEVD